MIKLYGFGAAFETPDTSPFVMKAMILLKMAGVPFENITGTSIMRKAPKGKLPYIEDKGRLIADTRLICAYLEKEYGADFSGGYDAATLATGLMAERMLEESSYFCSLQSRWMRPDGWAVLKQNLFGDMPAPLRAIILPLVRRKIGKYLDGQGTGRMSDAEIDAISAQNTKALSAFLGEKPYLLGERPCASDATALAFLIAASTPAFPGAIRDEVINTPNLAIYRNRLMAQYLPDFSPDML